MQIEDEIWKTHLLVPHRWSPAVGDKSQRVFVFLPCCVKQQIVFLAVFLTAVLLELVAGGCSCLPQEGSFLLMLARHSLNPTPSTAQLMWLHLIYCQLQPATYKYLQNAWRLDMRCGLLAPDQGNGSEVSSQLTALHWKSITLLPLIVCCVTLPIVVSLYGIACMWRAAH